MLNPLYFAQLEAGNGSFSQKHITQNRKSLITQSKYIRIC